jgi:class 3 adenylate cyclase
MSVRYRLFLIISGLFVFIAVCSAFLENYVMKRELAKAQEGVRNKILSLSEKKRIDLQSFLTTTIVENEVKIDAILTNLSTFTQQVLRFGPTTSNIKNGTWGDAADLLLEYKWIDFIQNTNEGKTTAAIVPQPSTLSCAYRIDIDTDLCWIYLNAHPDPYVGVKVPYTNAESSTPVANDAGVVPSAFLLFDVKQMAAAPILQPMDGKSWPPIHVNWAQGYVLEIDPFVKAFQRARELLKEGKLKQPQFSPEEISAKIEQGENAQGGVLNVVPEEPLLASASTEDAMKQKLEEYALRYTQIDMIWAMIAIYNSGIFGSDLFSFPSPPASAVFALNNNVGLGVNAKDVLFPDKLFEDARYFSENPPKSSNTKLAASIALIESPVSDHVFFGNTVRFGIGEKIGFLTIGSDADIFLQHLVLAIRQAAILYMDGPLSAYGMNGEKLHSRSQTELPFSEMVANKSGIVPWNGVNYFYLNLQPFPDMGLHVFVLNPEEKEFAFLRDLEEGSEQVAKSILLNIHIAGLIGLGLAIVLILGLSRRMTKPIIQLAKATKDVAEGRLDQIELTLPPLRHHDEIAVLCHSFEEMVKGLKEKEKVKGVLNKVVSREIAQEILNGTVHLGGEEKVVTVLFADIRDFTKITQNMAPKEVIEILNTCMTKISHIIDANGGVIDKYVGDEAMALFGAPIFCKDAAIKAIRSALEMADDLKEWNRQREARGQPAIEIGIGIHTGAMLAGNMGAENRLNYTVIGSNVNLAARLCKAAKRMEILVSKDTLNEPLVKETFLYEEISMNTFKGFDQPVEVYSIKGIK